MTVDLARLINPACSFRDYAKNLYGATDEEGVKWSLVTDGHMLMAAREDRGLPEFLNVKSLLPQLKHYEGAADLGADVLWRWLDGVDSAMAVDEECAECHGEGEVDCDCDCCVHTADVDCPECGGSGRCAEEPVAAVGTIKGRPFNRRFFKRALESVPVPLGGLTLSIGPAGEDPVRLSGDGWFLTAMPLRLVAESTPVPELLP